MNRHSAERSWSMKDKETRWLATITTTTTQRRNLAENIGRPPVEGVDDENDYDNDHDSDNEKRGKLAENVGVSRSKGLTATTITTTIMMTQERELSTAIPVPLSPAGARQKIGAGHPSLAGEPAPSVIQAKRRANRLTAPFGTGGSPGCLLPHAGHCSYAGRSGHMRADRNSPHPGKSGPGRWRDPGNPRRGR